MNVHVHVTQRYFILSAPVILGTMKTVAKLTSIVNEPITKNGRW